MSDESTLYLRVNSSGVVEASGNIKSFLDATNKAKKGASDLEKDISNLDSVFNSLSVSSLASIAGLTAVVGAFTKLTSAMVSFGKTSIQTYSHFEQIQSGLSGVLRSTEKGAEMFENLRKFSFSTTFGVDELADASQQLLTTGVSVDQLNKRLKMLGDIAGGQKQKFADLVAIYAKIQNLGKAGSQQLEQLSLRGIPIRNMLKEIGVTGVASADDITRAFEAATAEGGMFHDAMGRIIDTIEGKEGFITDTWKEIGVNISEATGLSDVYKSSLDRVYSVLDSFNNWLMKINENPVYKALFTGVIVGAISMIAVALGTTLFAALAKTIAQLTVIAGLKALINPAGLAIGAVVAGVAIGGITAALSMANSEQKELKDNIDNSNQYMSEENKLILDQISNLDRLIEKYKEYNDVKEEPTSKYKLPQLVQADDITDFDSDNIINIIKRRGRWINSGVPSLATIEELENIKEALGGYLEMYAKYDESSKKYAELKKKDKKFLTKVESQWIKEFEKSSSITSKIFDDFKKSGYHDLVSKLLGVITHKLSESVTESYFNDKDFQSVVNPANALYAEKNKEFEGYQKQFSKMTNLPAWKQIENAEKDLANLKSYIEGVKVEFYNEDGSKKTNVLQFIGDDAENAKFKVDELEAKIRKLKGLITWQEAFKSSTGVDPNKFKSDKDGTAGAKAMLQYIGNTNYINELAGKRQQDYWKYTSHKTTALDQKTFDNEVLRSNISSMLDVINKLYASNPNLDESEKFKELDGSIIEARKQLEQWAKDLKESDAEIKKITDKMALQDAMRKGGLMGWAGAFAEQGRQRQQDAISYDANGNYIGTNSREWWAGTGMEAAGTVLTQTVNQIATTLQSKIKTDTTAGKAISSGLMAMQNMMNGQNPIVAILGGLTNFLFSWLMDEADDDKDNSKREREILEEIKSQLETLSKTVDDQLTYLNEVQLKMQQDFITQKIESGSLLNSTKVNDMILTPQGQFSTAPDDYIIATKDPNRLGSSPSFTTVNVNIENNASDTVTVDAKEQENSDGVSELLVTISKKVASDVATGSNGWDTALATRESRIRGRSF